MFGRFLACLALLTGLVAVSAPAHASIADMLDCEIGVTADMADASGDDRRTCHRDEAGSQADEGDKSQKPAKRARRVVRPPVLYGIDRAYE